MNTHFQRPDHIHDQLHVVTPVFNSARFRTRWKHYQDFAKMVHEAGAVLHTVEVAFGERDHVVTTPEGHFRDQEGRRPDIAGHRLISLRTTHEMWLKEASINVAVQHLSRDFPGWRYVAWIDCDTAFARDDWANETLHLLQHYDIIQMWSQYQDLTANHEIIGSMPSFMHNYCRHGRVMRRHECQYGQKNYPGAPGLAWACTRRAWDTLGGLLDVCILGACDWYMAHALVGEARPNRKNHPAYSKAILDWQERASELRRNVGVMPGLALHRWHGPKVHRKYGTREQILIDTQFDPTRHLSRDAQGLLQFTRQAPYQLRDRVRAYLHERKEDNE